MNTQVRWLFSWRGIRRILIVLAWIALIIALWYGEENWRGWRAWNKYRHELEARGEQLDLKSFIPKPVPDEQNFAATPFIKSAFGQKESHDSLWEDIYSQAVMSIYSTHAGRNNGLRWFVSLVAWQMAFDAIRSGRTNEHQRFESDRLDSESRAQAAPAVLQGLQTSEPRLAEFRAASRRAYSRYPVVYDLEHPWEILLPHLATVKGACGRLKLKSCAELAIGQGTNALEDVKLIFYLADSVREEPCLISRLMRMVCFQLATQPIWEGLAEHRWSETQLQELQSRLQRCDFVADLKRTLEAERAFGILIVDLLSRQKYRLSTVCGDGSGPTEPVWKFAELIARIAPHGWYDREKLNYCRLFQIALGGTFDASKGRVWASRIESNAHELNRELSGGRFGGPVALILQHRIAAALFLPALGSVVRRSAEAQTTADQAALACALERYRLAKGQFPENLETLVPQFIARLPSDLLSGEPYKYRRTDDGQFTLYSVGWNEKDDGGVTGKTFYDEKHGDWVWQYPPK